MPKIPDFKDRIEDGDRAMRIASILLAVGLLIGCGGGGDSNNLNAYQQAVDQANAKESEARLLAVDTPCDQAAQCGTVSFTDPKDRCAMPIFKPYSLVSLTAAAAKAASDQQLVLAAHARELSSQSPIPCPAFAVRLPVLVCMASKCQVVQ
jgi:hypothetical protein